MERRDPENQEDGDPEVRSRRQGRERQRQREMQEVERARGQTQRDTHRENQKRQGNRETSKTQKNANPRTQSEAKTPGGNEDTATALQRLVELTATRVTPVRKLRVQYHLIRKLGSGSYGHVLLARPRQGGPVVALKLLPRDSVLRTTFLREFCVGRCVSLHPGIIQTLAGPLETPRHFAFAQEYAPCGDLSGMLEEQGLPELQVKRVVAQVAGALDFLHGRGLVHADVKPGNVLVFDPVCSRVALGDLGLTRPEGSPTSAPPWPLPSAPPELCLLLPPETLPLRPAVDSWGLGVLLFCAAIACFPWDVALAPDPEFEAFAGWMINRPQPLQPPPPWDQFAPPALALLQGLLDLDHETRRPPLAVLDFLGDDWGLKNKERPGCLGSMCSEVGEEEEEGGASLEEWSEEEENDDKDGGRTGTDGGEP
ncbi:uncharacterized serine/threonine-protein kinase SBK3 isoform X2 [Balaenoptera acutorostrata]|uniref:Uncharacterized serine/threonine-protein kinase SBK3 isoform X2 n=1 Tax=Balaenoptera acutorostrata TaxID=9767 RepID=A0ABM3SKF8_BALAC|nr:uncharacterized serine/threonine-protein kinase SBK3 isoform X2 [Balaenoptera acutorostrata]